MVNNNNIINKFIISFFCYISILDWPVQKWKHDCTNVDDNQFDNHYYLNWYTPIMCRCSFVWMHRHSVILFLSFKVKDFNGKVCNWLWRISAVIFAWVFCLLFRYIIVEQWRRKVRLHQVWADWWKVPRLLKKLTIFLFCWLYTTHQYTLRNIAIVDCTMLSTMLSKILLQTTPIAIDCTHIGSTTVYFEDLVTLHRTLQQIFWLISYSPFWTW